MIPGFNSALSGLAAAGKRLEVSANNIANQFSTKKEVNGQTVDEPYTPQRVDQVSLNGGGVLTEVSDVNPATVTVPDTTSPTGLAQLPNVNLEGELVAQNIAAYDYKANLKTIKVQDEIQQNLLDIIS